MGIENAEIKASQVSRIDSEMANKSVLDKALMSNVLIVDQDEVHKNQPIAYSIKRQCEQGGGICFVDLSQDLSMLDELYQVAEHTGRLQDILVVNPFRQELSNTYNPIISCDADVVVDQLLTTVQETTGKEGAALDLPRTKNAIKVLVGALKVGGYAYNLRDLAMFMMKPDAIRNLHQHLLANHGWAKETTDLGEMIASFVDINGEVIVENVRLMFGCIASRLYIYGAGKLAQKINDYSPEVEFFSAIRSNKLIYLSAPVIGGDRVAASLRSMMLIDLNMSVAKLSEAVDPHPIPFIIMTNDAHLLSSDELASALTTGERANINFHVATRLATSINKRFSPNNLVHPMPVVRDGADIFTKTNVLHG